MSKARVTIRREVVVDSDHDASYLEQEGFEDRLAQYRRGEFGYCGVRAVATIETPFGRDWISTTLASPGLWGIEDDSGESYFEEVYQEERKTLLDMLASIREYELA